METTHSITIYSELLINGIIADNTVLTGIDENIFHNERQRRCGHFHDKQKWIANKN